MVMTAMRWTKADIKRLTDAINAFYVESRPMSSHGAEFEVWRTHFRRLLDTKRTAIITAQLSSLELAAKRRAEKDRAAAKHFESHPEIYNDLTPEMVARFAKLADENDAGAAQIERLIGRVKREPLPREVVDFDPLNPGGSHA